jgi:Ca2+-binding EF-hand superfamily protein
MEYFGHDLPEGWKKMVKEEFKKADKDGSGEVSVNEMGVYLFELIDSNGDGAWDFKEVKDAIEAIARFSKNTLKDGWKVIVKKVFDAVDKNGDGKASPKEILAALKKHGVPDINDLFK